MALIKCPECGSQISDKASQCPNCGCPSSEFHTINTSQLFCPDCGNEIVDPVANCPNCSCPSHLFVKNCKKESKIEKHQTETKNRIETPIKQSGNENSNTFNYSSIFYTIIFGILVYTFINLFSTSYSDDRPTFEGVYTYTDAVNHTYKINLQSGGYGTFQMISATKDNELFRAAYSKVKEGVSCSWKRDSFVDGEKLSYYAVITVSTTGEKIYLYRLTVYTDYDSMKQHIYGMAAHKE